MNGAAHRRKGAPVNPYKVHTFVWACLSAARPPGGVEWLYVADLTVIPGGGSFHPSVDRSRPDPSLREDGKRQCVDSRKSGERCGAYAISTGPRCAFHSGLADPAVGGKAKAAAIQRSKDRALELDALSRLGTRAIVAQVFSERAGDVRSVVGAILDDALDLEAPAATRRAARTALLPWLDQALGRPKESVEVTLPATVEEIEEMDYAALLAARDALRNASA